MSTILRALLYYVRVTICCLKRCDV